MSASDTAASVDQPNTRLSDGYVRYALGLMLLIYTLNFVDRQIVAILGEDLKRDLDLDDTQFGLLGGLAFALFYTVLGIPIARLAERGNRVGIISVALAVWSGFTAMCGAAQNFMQILLFRIGVGVGEAGCTPPAHSLISDYIPAERRASALALYSMGVPIGSFAGYAVGALIAQHFGWRIAFFAVGLPGIAVALLAWFTLKEPRKLRRVVNTSHEGPSFDAALRELAGKPTYIWAVLGATVVSFLGYGHAYYVPAYLARVHEMGLQERGLSLAVMTLIAGVLGTWLGGQMADRAAKKDVRAYMSVPAGALVLGGPLFLAGILLPNSFNAAGIGSGYWALIMLAVPTMLNSLWYGPVYSTIQGLVHPRSRATAVAVMFFVLNLIGLGGGPLLIGFLSDVFAAQHAGIGALDAFKKACPPSSNDAMCLAARAEGVRLSLAWTGLLGFLGLFCFLMARRTVRQDLEQVPIK
jgi:predicted MFS family arabinose efflux permease